MRCDTSVLGELEPYCFLPSKNIGGNVFGEWRRAGVLQRGPGFCAKRQNRDGEGTRSRAALPMAKATLMWDHTESPRSCHGASLGTAPTDGPRNCCTASWALHQGSQKLPQSQPRQEAAAEPALGPGTHCLGAMCTERALQQQSVAANRRWG